METVTKCFKLTVEYDGTEYAGWQRQKDQATIQGELEGAIQTIVGSQVTVHGSGRTDAGVHALGQVGHFHCATRLGPQEIQRALNALLPMDIAVLDCARVPDSFHARYDAAGKRYRYRIANRAVRPAVGRRYAWHIRKPLNLPAMKAALSYLQGTHDFKAFEGAGSPRHHTVRTVYYAAIDRDAHGTVTLDICANGFLRFMVRNIVGTLADVGLETLTSGGIKAILDSRDRSRAGATAPPHGLFLIEVDYARPCGTPL
ncbi:MAG: tRNA pseudouridine(38-40) synthase TruA [Desulfobacterales bacterium]|jgi:tRNA pseudouridine38-40 synthase